MIVATGCNHSGLNGCCTAKQKARGKTTTLLLLSPGRLSKNREKCKTLPLVTKQTFRYSQNFAHFLETVASLSSVHQSPHLVPLLRQLTAVHIGTPTLPRPVRIHLIYIRIYVSQVPSSIQILGSKFCTEVSSFSRVLHSQAISCGFAAMPLHEGSATKKLIL